MILLKPRVKLVLGAQRVAPELFFAITVAETIFENFGLSVSIGALLEGHSNHHRLGNEVDFVVPEGQEGVVANELKVALLDSYVVRTDPGVVHVVFLNAV